LDLKENYLCDKAGFFVFNLFHTIYNQIDSKMMNKEIVVMFVNVEEEGEKEAQNSIKKPICNKHKIKEEEFPEIWTIVKR